MIRNYVIQNYDIWSLKNLYLASLTKKITLLYSLLELPSFLFVWWNLSNVTVGRKSWTLIYSFHPITATDKPPFWPWINMELLLEDIWLYLAVLRNSCSSRVLFMCVVVIRTRKFWTLYLVLRIRVSLSIRQLISRDNCQTLQHLVIKIHRMLIF